MGAGFDTFLVSVGLECSVMARFDVTVEDEDGEEVYRETYEDESSSESAGRRAVSESDPEYAELEGGVARVSSLDATNRDGGSDVDTYVIGEDI